MADLGYPGAYTKKEMNGEDLGRVRDMLGEPTYDGQKWGMINLFTGDLKWYKATKRFTKAPARRRRS
jgi:hypothetical protein